MSTRATYQFIAPGFSDIEPKTTIYIHYDGYAEGAAEYFYRVLVSDDTRGGFATRFVRQNSLAELTLSHDAHADTEYRYTLHGDILTAQKVVEWREKGNVWAAFFAGSVYDFVNRYGSAGVIQGFTPFTYHIIDGAYRWDNAETAELEVKRLNDLLDMWAKNGYADSANYRGAQSRRAAYLAVLSNYAQEA